MNKPSMASMNQSENNNLSTLGDLRLLSKTKAAAYLGIGKKKLEKLTNEGRIKFLEIDGKKMYPVQALKEFIDSNLQVVRMISDEQTKSLRKFDSIAAQKNSNKDLINYDSIIHRIIQEKLNGYNYN